MWCRFSSGRGVHFPFIIFQQGEETRQLQTHVLYYSLQTIFKTLARLGGRKLGIQNKHCFDLEHKGVGREHFSASLARKYKEVDILLCGLDWGLASTG